MMPAPTDGLRPILGQLTCQFLPGQSPMKTLYVGLVPLMIGLYQVTLQMPADAGKALLRRCNAQSRGRAAEAISQFSAR